MVKAFFNIKLVIPIVLVIFGYFSIFNAVPLLPEKHRVIAEESFQGEDAFSSQEKQEIEKKDPQDKIDPDPPSKSPNHQKAASPEKVEDQKVAYLTFDDGPSKNVTPDILDILKKYQIQASFFVIGTEVEKNPDLLKRIAKEGHFIGNHGYSHNYKYLYASTKNFLADMDKGEKILNELLPHRPQNQIIRFPGGSFGKSKAPMRKAALDRGYQYMDWNVVSGDAEGHDIPLKQQLQRLKETLENKKKAVILMHDATTKQTTAQALPKMIDYLQSQGYAFKTLGDYEF